MDKIVFQADEGGPISNMRYEPEDYVLKEGEVTYAGTTIPKLSPLAVRQGDQIQDDYVAGQVAETIPQWGQDLINALITKTVIASTDLSDSTQAAVTVNVKVIKEVLK